MDTGFSLSHRSFGFLLLGVVLVLIGITVLAVAAAMLDGSGSVSGIILIGPIPIVFGAGPELTWLIMISLIVTALGIAVLVLSRHRRSG
jgi:uncharacterized membrane protein